jgi:DNA-binding beta-propeller fold protein YncE
MTTPKHTLEAEDIPAPKVAKVAAVELRYEATFNLHVHSYFDLSFDTHENLVAVVPEKNKVVVYDIESKLLRSVAEGQHNAPVDCVVDSAGRFFVAECCGKCVNVFRDDKLEMKIDVAGPMNLTLSPKEDMLYVASCAPPYPLKIFRTSDGSLVSETIVVSGSLPCGMAVLSTGELVFRAAMAKKTNILRADGSIVREIEDGMLWLPNSVAVDAHDNIYVTAQGHDDVYVFSYDGKLINKSASFFRHERTPRGVAVSKSGIAVVWYGGCDDVEVFSCK